MKISVVIPCYNDGLYIEDAYNSIQLDCYKSHYECILVNDGSTDENTIQKCNELRDRGVNVINQENKGLAAARNRGILEAHGDYILPLDCDNKIEPEIFIEAYNIMEEHPEIDVVYTNALRFGEWDSVWYNQQFNGVKLLIGNYIDACALIRKTALLKVGLYDENMPYMGHEDWELWVRFFLNKNVFYYYKKIGFHYRVRGNSMVNTISMPNESINREYILEKNWERLLEMNINPKQFMSELIVQNERIESLKRRLSLCEKMINTQSNYYKKKPFKSIIKILLGKDLL